MQNLIYRPLTICDYFQYSDHQERTFRHFNFIYNLIIQGRFMFHRLAYAQGSPLFIHNYFSLIPIPTLLSIIEQPNRISPISFFYKVFRPFP